MAVLNEELGNAVAALARASRALNLQHVQLASDIAEGEKCSGHSPRLSTSRLPFKASPGTKPKRGIHLSSQTPIFGVGGFDTKDRKGMAAWRRAIELSLGDADVACSRDATLGALEARMTSGASSIN